MNKAVSPLLLLILCVAFGVPASGYGEDHPQLSALTSNFSAAGKTVDQKFASERTGLKNQFLQGWTKHEKSLQVSGKLNELLASKKEREEFSKTGVLQDGGSTRVQELKKIYRHSISRINQNESVEKAGLEKKYHQALQALATKLTKENKISEAVATKEIIDKRRKFLVQTSTPDQIGTNTKNYPQGPNSLGMKFLPISITDGPTKGKRILFSIWETRYRDFSVFNKDTGAKWKKTTNQAEGDHPASGMNLKQAKDFCHWLTERERSLGYIRQQDVYRLPSDHEWSCAVGIGKKEKYSDSPLEKKDGVQGIYPWGRHFPPKKEDGNYNWIPEDNYSKTSPVGSFTANQFGLFDMGGNLMEICSDPFADPENPSIEYCVMRDAPYSYGNPTDTSKSSRLVLSCHRTRFESNKTGNYWAGFRIVLEINGAL